MQKVLKNIFAPIKKFADAPLKFAIPIIAAVAFVFNLILEICARHSLVDALVHTFTRPHAFLANFSILFATMMLCLLLKRRIAMLTLVSVLWLALGITNAILIGFRPSPLSAIDFLILSEALDVVDAYLSIPVIILICAAIVAVIAGIVVFFIKCPKSKVNYKASLISVGAAAALCALMMIIISAIPMKSQNVIISYDKNGFAYCFSKSIFVHGVEKPDDEAINKKDEFMDKLNDRNDTPVSSDIEKAPNIVVVQLESFFDPKLVNDVEFSRDPIPNFSKLRDECISGNLQVAHIGGGTANVEFEFLTGMNLDHFGLGEFPYTTILKSRACESIAANLKKLDYTTHALHNHTGVFYGRNIVYPNLGFDTFTPLEMMVGYERTYLTFATDAVLVGEIRSALNSTQNQDFVFAVSVEGHGGYPHWKVGNIVPNLEDPIEVYGIEDTKEYYQYYFYANLINDMDKTVQRICDLMEETGEPYVLVFYGDHLPALPLTEDQLDSGNLYQSEYIIKTNLSLDGITNDEDINSLDRDLETYQLAAYIQELCGMSEGDITKLHQHEFETGEMYDDILKTLTYEQLYNEDAMYQKTDMVIGTKYPIIDSYEYSGGSLFVYGLGFNEYSKVILDGDAKDTMLVDDSTLMVRDVGSKSDDIEVAQIATDGTEFARAVKAAQ